MILRHGRYWCNETLAQLLENFCAFESFFGDYLYLRAAKLRPHKEDRFNNKYTLS